MERTEGNQDCDRAEGWTSSQSKDDSLTDFKSPKMKNDSKSCFDRLKIVGEKRPKKASCKGKSSTGSKKKERNASGNQNEKAQPSIESSFFKAGGSGKRVGHTCPLCIRYFDDAHAGMAHTKSCAVKNKVSTTKLLAAVALQERQADERLAIGLPAGPLVQSKDETPRRNRRLQTCKGDPDLQLALALSESLQENQVERKLEESLLLAAEHRGDELMPEITDNLRRSTLKNFGFMTNKAVSDVPIKPRRKKHVGPTILQTRTQESRDRLLTEKIAEILMGNEAITQVHRQELVTEINNIEKPPIVLKSRLLNEIHISTKRLWNSAELSNGVTNFYVQDLGVIVAPSVDRQRNDAAISSQRNPHSEADSPHLKVRETEEANDLGSPKNIYVTDRQYRNNLPTDWSNILNVSTMSDVVVLVNKNFIWAHKLVFHVRCSNILLECQAIEDKRFRHVKEKISWPEVDYLTALAFLEFVYSGMIVKNEHVFADDRIASLVRNLARKYRLKDLFEYMRKRKSEVNGSREELEGRKSMRSPIVIEVARRDRVTETAPAEPAVVVDNEQEPGVSVPSPCRKSCFEDLTIAETPDIDVDLIEDDPPTINAEANGKSSDGGRNRSVTSPDLFDDTTEEAIEDAKANSLEAAKESAEVSTNENPNLRVLAQLIAEDNLPRSDEANESDASSTASTFIDDALSEESLVAKRTGINSLSQGHFETPKSRTSSILNDSEKINSRKKPMPLRSPEKQKSNLSIFIQKVQKINAKAVLDSYNEEDSLGESYDRGRFRNPFNINNESNESISDVEGRAEGQLIAKKGALSALEEQLMLLQEKNNKSIDPRSNESAFFDESSLRPPLEKETEDEFLPAGKRALGSLERQSVLQDEKKDNDIDLTSADESAVLNDSSSSGHLDLEDSSALENAGSTDDENLSMYSRYKKTHKHNNSINKYRSLLIKLTEASASALEEDDRREVSRPHIEEAIDLTQESDSEVESSPTFSVGHSKRSCLRGILSESDSLVSREDDGINDKSSTADDCKETVSLSDDAANDSFDDAKSDDADPQARKVDEEIFTQSLKSRRSLTPSPRRSSDSAKKSASRRSKRQSGEGRSEGTSFIDNSKENERSHRTGRSSSGSNEFSHSSQYPNLDVFEVDENIIAESFRSSLSPNGVRAKAGSLSSKRGSAEMKTKEMGIADGSEAADEEEASSSDDRKKRRGTPTYSNFDVFEVNNEIFTQSFRNPSISPRKALMTSPSGTGKNDEDGISETPPLSSPILISSSPDTDPENARTAIKTRDSNKENSFLAADDNAAPFYSGRNTVSPPRFDDSLSRKPGPSQRRFSPESDGVSPRPAKNPLVRWNSMPTSTANSQRLKRTRTSTRSSQVALSRGVTPPLNYEAMDTPELKRELEKYGIKPQKAHRARQLLTHIFNELHSQVPTIASDEGSDGDVEPPAKKIGRTCSQSSEDSEPESVTSAVSVIPEEMEFVDGETESNRDDEASIRSSVKQVFTALINEDRELQNKMLTYEPLPLELLHAMLKARGLRCNVNELMDFLDEECITFRVQDQTRRQRANRGRGKKTAANGTRRPKVQKS